MIQRLESGAVKQGVPITYRLDSEIKGMLLMNQNTVFVIMKFAPDQNPQPCYAHKTIETASAAAERLNQGAPGTYSVVPMWVED